ncbi:MAG: hypothetical protein ACLRG4_00145, partial [[Ruminococcus] torques]
MEEASKYFRIGENKL